MAKEAGSLFVSLTMKGAKYYEGVRKAVKEAKVFGKTWDTIKRKMKGIFGSIKNQIFSLKGVIAGLGLGLMVKNFISAANEQAKAVIGLETAMKSMGSYTPTLSKNYQMLATDLQKVTNFGDEATLQGMKFLTTYENISAELMERTTVAMLDLAALMGGDVVRAANMMGKASMGLTGALRIAGISVDNETFKLEGYEGVLKAIEKQVSGQAEAMREAVGPWESLGNYIGDLKEKIGEFLKAALNPLGEELIVIAQNLNEFLQDWAAGQDWEEIGRKIKEWAVDKLADIEDGLTWISQNWPAIKEEIAMGWDKIATALEGAWQFAKDFIAEIKILNQVLQQLWSALEPVVNALEKVSSFSIGPTREQLADPLRGVVPGGGVSIGSPGFGNQGTPGLGGADYNPGGNMWTINVSNNAQSMNEEELARRVGQEMYKLNARGY